MIRHKLLIATAIIASVVITACSDITAPKTLVSGGSPTAAVLAPPSAPALLVPTVVRMDASAEASRPCPAPGGGFPGALNMLHDATMGTIPMKRDATQGNAGMSRAVHVSGC
jgi:hypothetical protein